MNLWIARDEDGDLYLYRVKPQRLKSAFGVFGSYWLIRLETESFPEITWGNSPKEVKLEIVNYGTK